jgi:hypothetical protein
MPTLLRSTLAAVLVACCLANGPPSIADELETPLPPEDTTSETWYRSPPTYQPNPRAIIHQKAMLRAQQRQARLEAITWYQMPMSRPTVPVVWGSLVGPVSFPVRLPPGQVGYRSPWVATAVSVGQTPDNVHTDSARTSSLPSQPLR